MTTLEAYLSSEAAVRDVAAQLEWATSPAKLDPDAWWRIEKDQAWTRIHVGMRFPEIEATCYYRPEIVIPAGTLKVGDVFSPTDPKYQRFIVSDLGEAVRALRLRTGWYDPHIYDDLLRVFREIVPPDWDVDVGSSGVIFAFGDGNNGPNITASDLPRAIVRVLCAAHRVSGMEVLG